MTQQEKRSLDDYKNLALRYLEPNLESTNRFLAGIQAILQDSSPKREAERARTCLRCIQLYGSELTYIADYNDRVLTIAVQVRQAATPHEVYEVICKAQAQIEQVMMNPDTWSRQDVTGVAAMAHAYTLVSQQLSQIQKEFAW